MYTIGMKEDYKGVFGIEVPEPLLKEAYLMLPDITQTEAFAEHGLW